MAMRLPRTTSAPLWFVLPAMLTLIYACTTVAYPLDFWHQVATGHLIWQQGAIPAYDTFSYTIGGQPVVNQNWLAQLAFYLLYRWGGFPLAQFVAGLCYAAAILVITRLAWNRSGNVLIGCGLGVVALAMAISNLTVRPQALSVLLFAAELFALYQWPGRWRTVVVVAGAELLWTNTHGAFPLGIMLPGAFLVAAVWQSVCATGLRQVLSDRVVRVDLAAFLAGLAAMFCNPHPSKTLDYVFGVVSRAPQRQIDEWLPTSAGDHAAIAYAASIALVLVVLGLSRKRLQPVDLLLLVSFAVLGNRAQRMIVWWGLVLAAVLAPQVAAVLRSWRKVAPWSTFPTCLARRPWSTFPTCLARWKRAPRCCRNDRSRTSRRCWPWWLSPRCVRRGLGSTTPCCRRANVKRMPTTSPGKWSTTCRQWAIGPGLSGPRLLSDGVGRLFRLVPAAGGDHVRRRADRLLS